jgi:hypothetical protein
LRAFALIFFRVRRAAFKTSWAVASAHRRWVCGSTLVYVSAARMPEQILQRLQIRAGLVGQGRGAVAQVG